jgi:Grx4 family monothiol glutaredoxin
MLFMKVGRLLLLGRELKERNKGTPTAPQCGFSRQAVEVLNSTGARFSSFNILEHADVRAGLKTLFNWPTFPQLYIKGNLVGGLDVMKELDSEGELKKMIPPEAFAPAQSLNPADNLEALVNRSPVMLFMKVCFFGKGDVCLMFSSQQKKKRALLISRVAGSATRWCSFFATRACCSIRLTFCRILRFVRVSRRTPIGPRFLSST